MERQTLLEPGSEEFLENESLIAEKIAERNKRIIIEQIQEMTDPTGNLSRIKMWKIRQRVCPRNENNVPVSKINEHGELISNKKELKSLYVSTYKHRLRHRNIAPGYEELRDLKNNLFSMRFEIAKLRKSDNWSEPELMKVLKGLKSNKATDPVGLVYELFKPGVAGSDLLRSLLILCNKIKAQCQIPKFLELANISSLYKHRGSKMDLNNDRGVFNVVTARSIIDKLVYNDYYDIMDSNMSDSNVGGRKKRNIRDNLFIVYGIINYSLKNGLDVDMNLYDIAKCFDAMWHQETMNDLWDVGVQDDRFSLISQMNKKCQIAIKTPVGISDRFCMEEIEMQGTVMGPIKCSVQMDTLGRD